MAIPVRGIPVLEGEVAERFERERLKAEQRRGTIKFSQEKIDSFRKSMQEYYQRLYGIH
ncbi:hypothetical protein AGMMS50239_11910 [Bacteroidia bacterium]|nr:hypothetical protein FACS1894207_1120 [Bacteroidia bacterium]GHT61300.1 hypothetical protein AGMMS50239_11910 [Bacteroidia bacterium]